MVIPAVSISRHEHGLVHGLRGNEYANDQGWCTIDNGSCKNVEDGVKGRGVGQSTDGGDKAASEEPRESPSLRVVFHHSLRNSTTFASDCILDQNLLENSICAVKDFAVKTRMTSRR